MAHLLHYINSISYLTPARLFNLVKIYVGYFLSVVTKRVFVFAQPYAISVEPYCGCNLACTECPVGTDTIGRAKGVLNGEDFNQIIQNIHPATFYMMLYFQGEPFLNSALSEMIKKTHQHNIYTITSTNGHFLTEDVCINIISAKLDKIIISLDGTNAEEYQRYRVNGDFDKVVSGIKTLVEAKKKLKSKTPFIELQFLVFRYNQHHMNSFKKMAKQLRVDSVAFKSPQIYNVQDKKELVPTLHKYNRYLNGLANCTAKSHSCLRLWTTMVATLSGDVVVCCYDKDGDYVMGNITRLSGREIWMGERFNRFRKQILTLGKTNFLICRNCNG